MEELLIFAPGIVLVLYTLISRRMMEPIIVSVVLAYVIEYGFAFPEHFINGIYETIMEETVAFLIVMLLLFGGLIQLITVSNGVHAMTRALKKKIKSRRMSLVSTWLLGISLFMEDYLNSLVVGTTMKKVTDKFKVPREQVSIISVTTSVPLSILVPITPWAVFIFGVLKTTEVNISGGQIDTYMQIIPYAVYPFICIVGTLLMTLGIIPKVFGLKKAYDRVEKSADSTIIDDRDKESDNNLGSVWNFILPILVLVIVTILTTEIVYGIILAIIITILWLKISKQMNVGKSVDTAVEGMGTMTTPLIFIVFAFAFGSILAEMGFADIMVDLIAPYINMNLVPLFSFLIVAILVFAGIDVWAVIPLVLPILIPLALTYEINPYIVIGTMISGISFGTQLCFISESNILVSSTLGLKPMDQILALLPYALFYAILTSGIYLFIGYTL